MGRYGAHGRRPANYSMQDYMADYQTMITDLNAASLPVNQILIGPSTCCNWNETELFALGYLTNYAANLKMVAVQRYPTGEWVYACFCEQHSDSNLFRQLQDQWVRLRALSISLSLTFA